MTHPLYKLYQNQLQQELPPVCWSLLEVMPTYDQRDDAEAGISLVDKQAVLAQLASREGAVPDAAAIRKRIQRINQALQQQEMSALKAQVRADSVRDTPLDVTEPDTLKPCEYRVFISHAWEKSSKIEGYLDEFVERLEQKLKSSQGCTIKVWFDRRDMRGNINRMADQYLPAARDSDFALFITSEQWCQSENCQREAKQFYHRPGPEDQRPYCVIQLINVRDDLCKPYRAMPNYPEFKFPDYANLTQLWECADEHIKDQLVREVRDQIWQYFDTVRPPQKKT
jgi:hypothetical protein